VQVQRVPFPPEECRNDKWLAFDGKTHVRQKRSV
jgi:hypothetical protein